MKFLGEVRQIKEDVGEPLTTREHLDNVRDPVTLTEGILDTKPRVSHRGYTHIRVSELDSICPREWVIGNVRSMTKKEFVNFSTLCTFDMGSAMHHWVQNRSTYFGDSLLGFWVCLACGNKRRFGVKPKTDCEFCNASPRATEYSEYSFRIGSPYFISGKADAILKVGSKYRFGEIKTYAKPITGPHGRDVAQLASYMWFSRYDESDTKLPVEMDRSVGYLIYYSKVFDYRAPVKTFPVRLTKGLVDPLRAKVQTCARGVNNGDLPVVIDTCISSNWTSSKANKCHCKKECEDFSTRQITNLYYPDGR